MPMTSLIPREQASMTNDQCSAAYPIRLTRSLDQLKILVHKIISHRCSGCRHNIYFSHERTFRPATYRARCFLLHKERDARTMLCWFQTCKLNELAQYLPNISSNILPVTHAGTRVGDESKRSQLHAACATLYNENPTRQFCGLHCTEMRAGATLGRS